ncbi:hypothetical protein MUN74_11865 [Agromyces endophyticus]|uniref:hypothetical protein n=1 Tax=Agromyces sp. H17E-10 TaxID=2932244 RepID=UPI001FD3DDEB|nr:hypothetical protein [Agromyces sp. H17E-10]UOQ87991.1 hypothetical protein MUN74_11865 [Agromyces sp. H17E-10]
MTRLRPVLAALPLLVLALAACSASPSGSQGESAEPTAAATAEATADAATVLDECAGVAVIVDSGDLEVPEPIDLAACVDTDGPILAADALDEAGVTTEGTDEWGDQVVCRVNGEPAESTLITAADGTEYHETCASMPAAFAYWALWQRTAGGEWAYAQEGLPTLELQPGDAVELLFTLNDAPASPAE